MTTVRNGEERELRKTLKLKVGSDNSFKMKSTTPNSKNLQYFRGDTYVCPFRQFQSMNEFTNAIIDI